MKDTIFLNLAFGDQRYIDQQNRCNASIRAIYPNANIKSWTNEYPPGSRTHRESLYGFKVHAIHWALTESYDKVVWLDCACILQKEVDYWFDLIPQYGVIAAKDDNKLSKFIADKYSEGVKHDWHLCGGSLYVFDLSNDLSLDIFSDWHTMEHEGKFGSQAEQSGGKINKHRHDESCMSLALYMNGSEPTPYDVCRYNNGTESIVIKDHFK